MKMIQILEDDDTIEPTDWCRPLQLVTMSGGHSDSMSFKSMYSGTPENNAQWVRVRDVMGPVWGGKRVRDYHQATHLHMEFVRGEVPASHRLNMKDYRSMSRLWKDYSPVV